MPRRRRASGWSAAARSGAVGLAVIAAGVGGVGLWRAGGAEAPVAAPPPMAKGQRIGFPVGRYPTLTLPDRETRVIHSLLNVDRRMRYGDFAWNDRGVPDGRAWVRIDLAAQTISVFRAGHEIGTAVILYGTDSKPTPSGVFAILERAEHHRSSLYDAEMPFMLRLTRDGVAIHASDVRRGSATHGCIGVPPEFARRLYAATRRGDLVAILPATAAPAG